MDWSFFTPQVSLKRSILASGQESTARNSAVKALEHDDDASVASDLSTNTYHVGLKQDLLSDFSSIQTPGSFASFGALARQPPTGLFVEGVGDIAMPLGEAQARQLMAKARQAPYGKGSDTIVDTAVRNTWELDAEHFTFRDPAWPGYVRALCARVAQDLGINTTIRAEIYKMLVYERGAMFKVHTDTEKIPSMFGTLVICLPSAHQGGEVVLKHCGEKKIFKTSDATQSYACWYSDVSHEVLPVTSGYRWVLIYNLALDVAEARPSAGLQRSETRALRHTLGRWLAESEASRRRKCIYHVLDHD
uniref:Prolyl 4-hydroxylase alpha subunit Fe(2+) 2OG dioxygenase domain-containing protein n=1 Tax=Tolypocladium ophioglossoides (strain CBS 100239) TaxID=1163406 RepID=A0A0L0NGR3_TOLOC